MKFVHMPSVHDDSIYLRGELIDYADTLTLKEMRDWCDNIFCYDSCGFFADFYFKTNEDYTFFILKWSEHIENIEHRY